MNMMDKVKSVLDSGIKQGELAEIAGMSQQAVSKFVVGKSDVSNMKLGNAQRLVDYYDSHVKEQQ